MSRIKDVSNIKNFVDTLDEISSDVDTNLNTIKGNLTELGISSSAFNKTNLINGLRNDPTIAPINTTDNKGDVEKVDGNDYYVGMPLNASLLKLGVSGRDPEDPATTITSNNNSRTLTTDRKDQDTSVVKRWATRCAFKFRSQDYGYDRCVYEIPTQYLMEGCVGTEGRHATTFSKYPYPEEIIMISADNDKNFIHFVNAQYLDGHYNYYNGNAYNLMIVKDRTNWGVLNDAGTEFKKYISVYANNVEDSLAFYIEDSSGIGYITFPMPDRSFGDELLNTLWDCKVIWRSDTPDRDFNITVEGEYREEYVNEIDSTWSQGNMPSNIRWSSVCYGNGKYVAVGSGNSTATNIMAYSTDGINWTQGNMPSSQNWESICYGNDKFVAIVNGSNIMAYSTDGISWTQGNMPSSQNWESICYGNDKFVAIVNDSNIMAYSTDGINWTEGTMPSSQRWNSVCYGNGKFVAVCGGNYNSNIMAYSTDGINWTEGNMPISERWDSVCYGNGKYVAISGSNLFFSNIMAYSTDGISWTEGTMPSSQQWQSVCYGNGKFVAVVYGYDIMAYSTDGINWTQGNMPSYQNWNSVCYGNGKFVAVARESNIMAYALSDYLFHPLFDLDKINGRVVLTEESNTRLARIRDTFDNLLEMNGKLTQVNHSTLTDYNNSKLNLYQLPEYNKYLSAPGFGGGMDKLIPWNDYYVYLGYNPNENGLNTTVLNKSLSMALDTSIYPTDFNTDTDCVYFGGITIKENTPTKFSFDFIEFGNNINGQWEYNVIHITYAKDSETGELSHSLLPAPDRDTISTKIINGACQIANNKYLVFTDTGADLLTIGDTVTVQQNYGTKVKSSLLTHYGMVSIPNNTNTIEANTNIHFSDCGDEIFSSIQSGNLYSYDDQSQYSDDVTGYEANDEGKALTAFDTGVFTTSTGKDLLLRAKLKFTFTSDFTLA